ncbi:MAG: hypothetical protein COB12_09775 [Flavobacterium sp.]|nr:MAG: hypothetical protein COB12_09775 [Flavobacterium sp.]
MKKNTLIVIVSLLIIIGGNQIIAQSPTFNWAKSMGSSNSDRGKSIAIDLNGNVLTTGVFFVTSDFDPGAGIHNLTSNGDADIFIQKLDPDGEFLWAKNIGGIFYDYGYAITTDTSGNVYVAGSFKDTVDFDPGAGTYAVTPVGDYDFFVLKLDSNGDFVWAKTVGGSNEDVAYSIIIDDSDNIYITGFFQNTADFDTGAGTEEITSNGSRDIYILKINSAGDFIWAKTIGDDSFDAGNSITLDSSENIYLTGYFYETVDFDPGAGIHENTSNGGRDFYILKLSSSGDFVWVKTIGGTGGQSQDDEGHSIIIDPSGNAYITGRYSLTVDFDPDVGVSNLTSNGENDLFIQKLDSDGEFIWAKSIGSTNPDYGNSISIDTEENIFVVGNFNGTVDFDPGAGVSELTSTIGSDDTFILELDVDGDYVWAYSLGETNWNSGPAITTDSDDNIYTTGNFKGSVDFDPSTETHFLGTNGLSDIFVLKLGDDILGVSNNSLFESLYYYPNPTMNTINMDFSKLYNKVTVQLTNYLGQVVLIKTIKNTQQFSLQLEHLETGIYLAEIITNSGNHTVVKIIKN